MCKNEEIPSENIPASQVLSIISKKISENFPNLLGKSRKYLKKVEVGSLYSIANDENTFLSFVNYLKNQD